MSLKTCLRIAPTTLSYIFTRGQSRALFTRGCNVPTAHNLARTIHVRLFFKDASRTEIDDSDGRKRVYYGALTTQIRAIKWFSLTTSLCGILAQPIIFKEVASIQNVPLTVVLCTFIGFFTFATPFLLHFITKKYVTHLDYVPDTGTYVASTVNFFCMLKEMKFTPDDVKVPDVPGMFTTFTAKGTPLFLDPRLFEDPSHYSRIMGYDKPMDFKLFETPSKDEKDK